MSMSGSWWFASSAWGHHRRPLAGTDVRRRRPGRAASGTTVDGGLRPDQRERSPGFSATPWRYPPAAAVCCAASWAAACVASKTARSSLAAGQRGRGRAGRHRRPAAVAAAERAEQYGRRLRRSFILKMFRRIEEGINPDLEIGRYLTESPTTREPPRWSAPSNIAGPGPSRPRSPCCIVMSRTRGPPGSTRRPAQPVLRAGRGPRAGADAPPPRPASLLEPEPARPNSTSVRADRRLSRYRPIAGPANGRAASGAGREPTDPALAPEPFGKLYQRSLYQSLRN